MREGLLGVTVSIRADRSSVVAIGALSKNLRGRRRICVGGGGGWEVGA